MHLLKLLGFGGSYWIKREKDGVLFTPASKGTYVSKTGEILTYSMVQDILWGDVDGFRLSDTLHADEFIGIGGYAPSSGHASGELVL